MTAIRDFYLQSSHCLELARSRGPAAVVYKSHATHQVLITCNMSRVTWCEGTAQQSILTELKSLNLIVGLVCIPMCACKTPPGTALVWCCRFCLISLVVNVQSRNFTSPFSPTLTAARNQARHPMFRSLLLSLSICLPCSGCQMRVFHL